MTSSSVENLINAARGPKVSSAVINYLCQDRLYGIGEGNYTIVWDVDKDCRLECRPVSFLAAHKNFRAF